MVRALSIQTGEKWLMESVGDPPWTIVVGRLICWCMACLNLLAALLLLYITAAVLLQRHNDSRVYRNRTAVSEQCTWCSSSKNISTLLPVDYKPCCKPYACALGLDQGQHL